MISALELLRGSKEGRKGRGIENMLTGGGVWKAFEIACIKAFRSETSLPLIVVVSRIPYDSLLLRILHPRHLDLRKRASESR